MTSNIDQKLRIIDSTFYSDGFPNEDWPNLIPRSNYIAELESKLRNGIKTIFVEGEEDSGKTTLLGQYAKSNVNNTITVFFNPLHNLDYSEDYFCTNIVLQICHILNEEIRDDGSVIIGTDQYRQKLQQLKRLLKKKKETITLIIDGLEAKIKDRHFITSIFSILPFGEESFRIIISGSKNEFLTHYGRLKTEDISAILISGFSDQETLQFLGIESSSPSQIKEIFTVTKGYPGRLKTLKRVLKQKNDNNIDDIFNSENYQNWIELDCESIDINNPQINAIVSILALDDNSFNIQELADILNVDRETIRELVDSISILECSEKFVSISSIAHKKYLANILRSYKEKVNDLLFSYYTNSGKESLPSLIKLPKILTEKKDWKKIIGLLNEEYVEKLLDKSGSLKAIADILKLGIDASERTNQYHDLLRYSIQGSIINELDNYLFWESEIEAHISIKDFSGAISLAESAPIHIDRLKLLSLIAKRQKELNKRVDEILVSTIKELYKKIDLTDAGEKIYDIVAHLIYALPNIAIEIVENSSKESNRNNINDWIITKLSFAAIDSTLKEKNSEENQQRVNALQTLNNPLVKKIQTAISFMVGNYSADKVLDEVQKILDGEEKLKLLRLWLSNQRSNESKISEVIEVALNELIGLSSETPITIESLIELSKQLPFVKDVKKRETLYNKFRTIENDLSDLGLKTNKFIYKLNMFHTEYSISHQESIPIINRIIKEVDQLDDLLIKIEAFAEVFHKLTIINNEYFRSKINFLYSRILTLSSQLFETTASHYKLSENFLRTIAKRNPNFSLKIIEGINNKTRREDSRLLVLESYLDNNLKFVSIDAIQEIEKSLEDDYSKEFFLLEVLDRYSNAKSLHYKTIFQLMYFINKVDDLSKLKKRIKGYLLGYKILIKNSEWKEKLGKRYETKIYNSWKALDADWEKLDEGFKLVYEFSKDNDILSKQIFNETEVLKNDSWIDSKAVAFTYINSLSLVIKAFNGVIISSTNTDEDMQIIEDLIARIPSEVDKLRVWTELGFIIYNSDGGLEMFKSLMNDHIIPITHELTEKQEDFSESLDCLTLIYLIQPDLALKYIGKLRAWLRDQAVARIIHFYVTKQNPFEHYDQRVVKFNCIFTDLSTAVNLLKELKTDSELFFYTDLICKAIQNNRNLAKPQTSTLTEELKAIIHTNLPDVVNIKHEGYKILCELKIAKISKHESISKSFWEEIIRRAKKIPNISDSILVMAIILDELPFEKINNPDAKKREVYNSITSNLNSLRAHYEFVQRVNDISEHTYQFDRVDWKKYVDKAFNLSNTLEDGSEIYLSQRNIIDSIYRLDPDFAKELIKNIDENSKDKRIGKTIQDHYKSLELTDKIKNNKTLEEKDKSNTKAIVRSLYHAIKSINSEKTSPKKIAESSMYLGIGVKLPLHEAFPVYMYYLNNCSRTYRNVKDGTFAELHRKNFREAVKATNLIQLLSRRKKTSERSYRQFFIDEEFSNSNRPIKPRSREAAFNYIKEWISEQAEEFLIIADPYFVKEDLEILKLIKETKPDINIDILGSKDMMKENLEDSYQAIWKSISDEQPPFVNFTFCLTQGDKDIPFHDRWIITKNGGLRIGTSINSLGMKRESEISVMKPKEALRIYQDTLIEYIKRTKKEFNGQRLAYKAFSM